MKVKDKFIILATAAALILAGCGKRPDNEYFELMDTKWEMTMDEVLQVYGVKKEDTSILVEGKTGSSFAIDNGHEMFGENTSRILFNFMDPSIGNKEQKLCQIDIYYPDHTDTEHVLKEMKKLYGAGTIKEVSIYRTLQSLGNHQLPRDVYKEGDALTLWAGSTVKEVIPEAEAEDYINLWAELQPGLNKETWAEFSENARLVTVICSSGTEEFPMFAGNGISISAKELIIYNELKKQLSNP